jgi:hypothetical protein
MYFSCFVNKSVTLPKAYITIIVDAGGRTSDPRREHRRQRGNS